MRPYYEKGGVQLFVGDALELLHCLPSESVNCCVTSPPYWGLRDYGTAQWEGGDGECDHKPVPKAMRKFTNGRGEGNDDDYAGSNLTSWTYRDVTIKHGGCPKGCGAVRIDSQLGLERTPEEYTARMVEVLREVRRVLADDGTLWLNLGDSYTSGGRDKWNAGDNFLGQHSAQDGMARPQIPAGLKPKDLVGIPWRVAFALQADGWYLRSDIIWKKPNPMPESVTDRPTKAHEYLFLLSKSERYFYNADAIKESLAESTASDKRLGVATGTGRQRYDDAGMASCPSGMAGGSADGRNRRSVWTVATQPYAGAHFATFPVKLVEPCILAGCPEGGTVIDPFSGSGTTLQVARECRCKAIGIELNPAYAELCKKRLEQGVLQFES